MYIYIYIEREILYIYIYRERERYAVLYYTITRRRRPCAATAGTPASSRRQEGSQPYLVNIYYRYNSITNSITNLYDNEI